MMWLIFLECFNIYIFTLIKILDFFLTHQLDIIQQEYINDSGLIQIELTKAAFGCYGNWLATVEQRQEKETELELQMKIWSLFLFI